MLNDKFKDRVIEYFKKYYKKHKKAPPTRQVFKHFSKAKFYQTFPKGIAEVCKLAGIPVPEAHIERTEKAVQALKKKRVVGQKTARQPGSLEDIQQSIEIQNAQERYREKTAKEEVERLKILFRDPNPKVSGPIKDALGEIMPEITEHMFGIKVTVPELIAMQKTYDEAREEGWYVEDVFEWAALSKEEQETFKELREKAYDKGLPVNEYMEGLKAKSLQLSGENERLSRIVERLKREEERLNERCSRLNRWLEEDYQRKKKGLEEKYLRDIDGCKVEFLKFKKKLQALMKELQNDYKDWETKRDRLITECENIEKQFDIRVKAACETLDKIKAETTEARNELKQLRASVGPKGTVTDLEKQNDELKQQLAEKDRQLAEKAMQVAGKWLNQEEAIQKAEGVYRFVLDEVERRIESAGPALYVLEFLESELPDEKFKELTFAINMAQVKRESQNPDNPYFADIPLKKKKLLGAFPNSIEEYKRLHNEKMERLEKHRRTMLNQIRRDAMGFGIATRMVFGLLDEVMKPVAEAYFNPKKPRPTTTAKNDRTETDGS